ncbi:uncharacterized protein LOC111601226 [Drosophila hydei]|uniref:Uncharacterized protein LOC111601226 n=1 Tax=Drosophila hydei TaxID=7224 RepID=A0A6J1M5C2_DROHY|nr:uncharacterized protein LOC111601226 [Drosophila hydei]
MNYLGLRFWSLLSCVLCASALVHYQKMDKGKNGCRTKPSGKLYDEPAEIKVGGILKDENTCGIYVCQNTEGDALIHYQRPVPFEMCSFDGVSTVTPFPECCWKCVTYISCDPKPISTVGRAAADQATAAPAEADDASKYTKLDAEESPVKVIKKKMNYLQA